MTDVAERLRWLPAVHACIEEPPPAVRDQGAGPRVERAALDRALDGARASILENPDHFEVASDVENEVARRWAAEVAESLRPALRPVINATGVIVHTNLGRAPLAAEAIDAARVAGERYTPLEYDLEAGARGSRYAHAARWLTLLSGAEAAIVVNNNAAALLLAVDTLARGRSVVVSRGELVEIGGGFRVHEIIGRSGARVIEVGATNKTHPDDYERAFQAGGVGAVVKVHRSNFAVTGFVAEVGLESLSTIADPYGVPVVYDQGTGVVDELDAAPGEPTVRAALKAGATVVCASADKLLGGPQAGLLFGDRETIDAVRANPLLRALRVDKSTLAALEATLRLNVDRPAAVPVRRMLELDADTLAARAEALCARLSAGARSQCSVEAHAGHAGGGTLPGTELPGYALRVTPAGLSIAGLERSLRGGDPPIIARVVDDAVWIDVRTLLPGESEVVAARLDELLTE